MKSLGTVTLKTERLVLRRFTLADAQQMFDNWASNDNVSRFLTWQSHKSADETKAIISHWIKEYESDDIYRWTITINNEPIGMIDVVDLNSREDAQIGYCLDEKYWGQGIMTEAFNEVIRFLFNEVGVHRISARHIKENSASGAVMKKCGLKYEGTLRDNEMVKGEWRDMCEYSLFKSEYKN